MSLTLITPPSTEPVTLAEAKSFLRVDGTTEDVLIEELIEGARRRYDGEEGLLGRALVTQTWQLRLDAFPKGAIEIPLPPLQSVDTLTYTAADGSTQTLVEDTDFTVDTHAAPGRVVPVDTWPATKDVPNAVVIEFTAGYGIADAVPVQLKTAIKQTIASWYDASRTSVVVDMGRPRTVPLTGDDLALDFKVAWEF